ncbi:signal peptidase II [Candidatus Methylacidiphilum infernorum]|uniref:signal peptidase II n=1 Tax=Candidatus Methylacidiphilum infernorum TaxID=511746 RepID=UPI0009A1AB85|nr:signal peptidase II [Candidatus Methylacidiphilum infernorum]
MQGFHIFFFVIVFGFLLLLDLTTKYWISSFLEVSYDRTIIPGFLDLVYVENTGIAFGLFAGNNRFWEVFTLLLILIGFFYFRKKIFKTIPYMVIGAMIFAGALGNGIDRIIHGHVTDFIDVHFFNYHWPAFNLADTYLTLGFSCIFLYFLKLKHTSNQKNI